jgi:hypothetical protein
MGSYYGFLPGSSDLGMMITDNYIYTSTDPLLLLMLLLMHNAPNQNKKKGGIFLKNIRENACFGREQEW